MIDKETYKREIVRMWDSIRDDEYKIYNACNGVSCSKCPLHGVGCSEPLSSYEVVEIVKKWSKEHPEKKYKVSRLEYDILDIFIKNNSEIDYVFNNFGDAYIPKLLEKGYFKGAKGNMSIRYYLKNCEVIADDD